MGPMAARIWPRAAPSRSIAATVASITPDNAPRQPACAAPTTPACGSAKSTGPQSAVVTPTASARMRVTMASACGRVSLVHGASATATCGEWT